MTALPPGWIEARLGGLADTSLGKMLDKKRATGFHPTPYLRNINVRWGGFDLNDLNEMDIAPIELERVLARPGDLIVCEGGEPGRAAVWKGPGTIALQKALHRIRSWGAVRTDYLAYFFDHLARSRRLERLFTGTTIKHLPQEKLRLIDVPVPPLAEQQRIVAAIEEQCARLDGGIAALESANRRLALLRNSVLACAYEEAAVNYGTTALTQMIGRNSLFIDGDWVESKDQDASGEYRLTQLADVGDGEWRNRSNRRMNEEQFRRLGCTPLHAGDVLVARMPDPLGRACQFPGDEHVCATVVDVAILRPDRNVSSASWLMRILNAPQCRRQIEAVAKGTTRRRISRRNLEGILVPKAPRTFQDASLSSINSSFECFAELGRDRSVAQERAARLRASILEAAFAGELLPQDLSDEPASALLARIVSERTKTNGHRPKTHRAVRRSDSLVSADAGESSHETKPTEERLAAPPLQAPPA